MKLPVMPPVSPLLAKSVPTIPAGWATSYPQGAVKDGQSLTFSTPSLVT